MAFSISYLSGVVLAGGASSRMGSEKALLTLDGLPLWRRQYNLLAHAGVSDRLVSVRRDQNWPPPEVVRVIDAAPDGGPLVGIIAAMTRMRHPHLLVLAVDLPKVPVAWVARLRERCSERMGAVGQHANGTFEPLAAIYPQAFLSMARAAMAAGELSLQKLLASAVEDGLFREVAIMPEETSWFENWNAPEDVSGVA
jgi:Molybdopterin-guanine dinucleotide biosynthesis protein A